MSKILMKLYLFSFKVFLVIYYCLLSFKEKITTKRVTNVISKVMFNGGNVLLFALYEKHKLREDTIELLKQAKSLGIYVIAVNTLKLAPENYTPELIDVYIEKDNFGRDFGSYKAGFKYVFDNNIDKECTRLLILNDSVFFSKKGLKEFLSNLYSTQKDVLGATENCEIAHHLGSFCISVSGDIVRKPKFKAYWEKYKLTNVRPLVIRKGEFSLSKLLRGLSRDETNFSALYDVKLFEKKLIQDEALFRHYYKFRREGGRKIWVKQYLSQHLDDDYILKSFYQKQNKTRGNYDDKVDFQNNNKLNIKYQKDEESNVVNFVDFACFLSSVDYSSIEQGELLKERLMSIYLDDFTVGSQIHNNCIALHHIGLPIIKLDLLYRSLCNFNDVMKIREQLDISQRDEFMSIMTSRLSGDRFLFGLNRKAFIYGIL